MTYGQCEYQKYNECWTITGFLIGTNFRNKSKFTIILSGNSELPFGMEEKTKNIHLTPLHHNLQNKIELPIRIA